MPEAGEGAEREGGVIGTDLSSRGSNAKCNAG